MAVDAGPEPTYEEEMRATPLPGLESHLNYQRIKMILFWGPKISCRLKQSGNILASIRLPKHCGKWKTGLLKVKKDKDFQKVIAFTM